MERLGINAVLNSGAIYLNGKYYLVARVEGNDRKSFFAVAESGCQNRVNVSVINSVVAVGHNVFSVDESLVFGCHPCFVSFKICHIKQFPFGKKSS